MSEGLHPVPGRFEGRVCAVTGGASGIGKAVARRLGREGGKVVLFDRDADALDRAQGELRGENLKVIATRMDVTQEASVQTGFDRVMTAVKRLDVLVHCAGVPGLTAVKIDEYPVEEFDRVVTINLKGTFLVGKYAVKAMLERDYGRVLLLSSIAGKEGNPGMIGYSASKAGVIGMVKALGKEYARTGIRVNGLAPAVVRTPILDQVKQEQIDYMTDLIPMKRVGTLDEAAALCCWIVSEECSFTTGFVFDLSGGRATY